MITALSASHREFTLAELERLDRLVGRIDEALATADEVAGHALLATCHRIEVYADTSDPDAVARRIRSLIAAHEPGMDDRLVVHQDAAAARHLVEVASGLASVVIGENEIAGQVKHAMANAHDAGTMSPALYRLFRIATRTAKAVAGTDLGRQGRSLVRAALAGRQPTSSLVIGTGAFARVAVAQLAREGCERIAVFSPSGRAEEFSVSHPVVAVSELADELATTDLVLGCSGRNGPSLTVELVAAAVSRRRGVLPVIDLALRRDADPGIADLPGVTLTDLASVTSDADVDISAALALVDEAVAEHEDAERETAAADAVRAIRTRVTAVADAELARATRRLTDLTPDQAEQVRLLVHRITQGVLHRPSVQARTLARQGRMPEFEAALGLVLGDDQH